MKPLVLAVLVLSGCVIGPERRRMGPYGPAPLLEEMPAGRLQCKMECGALGRGFQEYTYDGACICQNDPRAPKSPTPGQTLNPNNQG